MKLKTKIAVLFALPTITLAQLSTPIDYSGLTTISGSGSGNTSGFNYNYTDSNGIVITVSVDSTTAGTSVGEGNLFGTPAMAFDHGGAIMNQVAGTQSVTLNFSQPVDFSVITWASGTTTDIVPNFVSEEWTFSTPWTTIDNPTPAVSILSGGNMISELDGIGGWDARWSGITSLTITHNGKIGSYTDPETGETGYAAPESLAFLHYDIVPEPSSALLAALASFGFLVRRRR